jgi:2-oxoglutarate dehydrogenase E1 component
MKNTLDELWGSSHLSIGHSAYLEDLFEQYLSDPSKLPEEWVNILFSKWTS